MIKKKLSVNDCIEKSYEFIENDRTRVSISLNSILERIKENTDNKDAHIQTGLILSKLYENLQRSTEQMLKLTEILSKKTKSKTEDLDTEDIYDKIKNEESSENL